MTKKPMNKEEDNIEQEFQRYSDKIAELKGLRKQLDAIDTSGFEKEVSVIKSQMHDLNAIPAIRGEIAELMDKIKKRAEIKGESGVLKGKIAQLQALLSERKDLSGKSQLNEKEMGYVREIPHIEGILEQLKKDIESLIGDAGVNEGREAGIFAGENEHNGLGGVIDSKFAHFISMVKSDLIRNIQLKEKEMHKRLENEYNLKYQNRVKEELELEVSRQFQAKLDEQLSLERNRLRSEAELERKAMKEEIERERKELKERMAQEHSETLEKEKKRISEEIARMMIKRIDSERKKLLSLVGSEYQSMESEIRNALESKEGHIFKPKDKSIGETKADGLAENISAPGSQMPTVESIQNDSEEHPILKRLKIQIMNEEKLVKEQLRRLESQKDSFY